MKYRTVFLVAPLQLGNYFPLDMLRYEGAYPREETDSYRIRTLLDPAHDERKDQLSDEVVQLVKYHNEIEPRFTDARWHSFHWTVVGVIRTEKEDRATGTWVSIRGDFPVIDMLRVYQEQRARSLASVRRDWAPGR